MIRVIFLALEIFIFRWRDDRFKTSIDGAGSPLA
jgi:hypothetical protein